MQLDDLAPYDPTVDYTDAPAIKEIAPDAAVPVWRPLNVTRRRFLQSVVCAGVAVSASALLFGGGSRIARADARAVERLITLNINAPIYEQLE